MSLRTWYLRKKFWANDFIHGSELYRQYRDVGDISENRGDCSYRRRTELLESILKYATRHVPFYKGMRWSSLSDFPIINKNIILQDYDRFLAPPAVIPGHEGPLHVQRTSGSTGIPFSIPLDRRCRLRRIATLKYYNSLLGHKSCEPMMHIRAVAHYWEGKQCRRDKVNNIWYLDNSDITEEWLANAIKIINDERIGLIRGYSTTLDFIAKYAIDNGLYFPHKPCFISVGENMSDSLRRGIVDVLGCNIVSQYATEENGVIAQSIMNLPANEMFLNTANLYVEILKQDSDEQAGINEKGRIVVTDFYNYSLPLIRYDIGDIAAKTENMDMLTKIIEFSGRASDHIYATDGTVIDMFNSFPDFLFSNRNIKQWQFIQKSSSTYMIKFILKDDNVILNEHKIKESFKKILGVDAMIIIMYVDELPVLSSGKRKLILNEWKK